jgi:RND superfamily putative drug exporter
VSLAALFAIDVNALRSMAVGAIVVVCISMLASITLLPALLAAVGTHVDRLRIPLPWRTTEEGSDAFWSGWARRVMRRPVTGLLAGAGVMLVLAIPFF